VLTVEDGNGEDEIGDPEREPTELSGGGGDRAGGADTGRRRSRAAGGTEGREFAGERPGHALDTVLHRFAGGLRRSALSGLPAGRHRLIDCLQHVVAEALHRHLEAGRLGVALVERNNGHG
jgi:hypothetical protein